MVFFIEPVGTFTAWTIKVIPNKAIMRVTTADSKYSRATLFLKCGSSCSALSRLSSAIWSRAIWSRLASVFSSISVACSCDLRSSSSAIR